MSAITLFSEPDDDAELERAIAGATTSGGLVTLNQVYRAWCEARYVHTDFLLAAAVLVLVFVPVFFYLGFGPLAALLPLASGAVILHRRLFAPSLERAVFDGAVLRRLAVEGSFEGVALAPALRTPERPPEADVFDYGVNRVLVVDDDLLVDRLIDAGFHATHQVLILSTSGYPSHVRAAAEAAFEQDCDVFFVQTYRRGAMAPPHKIKVPASRVDIGLQWDDLHWLASRLKPVPVDSGDISVDLLDTHALTSVLGGCITQKCSIATLLRPTAAARAAGGVSAWGASDFG